MPEIPIIGENTKPQMPEDPDPMQMVQKAFLVVQDPKSHHWVALDYRTPVEAFQDCTPEDVLNGTQRVRDNLLQQETAAHTANMVGMVLQRMNEAQQNQALRNSLNI